MPRIIISEPGKTPQPYRLKTDRELTTIGRGSDNDIILETGSASTNHCEMKRIDGGFILSDKNSTNGILLEDTRFDVIDLQDGMTVNIGEDIELNFTLTDEEIELLEEEDFEPQERVSFPKADNKKSETNIEEDDDDEEYEEVIVRRKKKKKKPVARDLDEDDDDDAPRPRMKKKPVSLDIDDEEEERKPKKSKLATKSDSARAAARPASRSAAPVVAAKSGGGASTTILFAVLAIIFLLIGMCIRHAVDNDGAFLFSKQEQK